MASDAKAKATARQRQRLTQLLAGGKHHLRDRDELALLGKVRTWKEVRALLEQMLQPHLDYEAAVERARAEVGSRRLALLRQADAHGAWLAAIAESLRGRFGRTHPAMRSFGLGRGGSRKPSAATQASAAEKRRRTRAAGGARKKRR